MLACPCTFARVAYNVSGERRERSGSERGEREKDRERERERKRERARENGALAVYGWIESDNCIQY